MGFSKHPRPPPLGYGPDTPRATRGRGEAPALPQGPAVLACAAPTAAGGMRMPADAQLEITDLVCRFVAESDL
ncbi:MAG TPA: hypothetical protein VHV50_10670, partial [Actinomycetota bacterium]|nr:hypothetical protein [Actinomycetota bacterium]